MRAVLTGGTEAAARYEQLLEALARTRFQLATVANNVNQLAHQANSFALGRSEPVQAEDVHEVLHEVEAVMERVEGVAGQIGARDDREVDSGGDWARGNGLVPVRPCPAQRAYGRE